MNRKKNRLFVTGIGTVGVYVEATSARKLANKLCILGVSFKVDAPYTRQRKLWLVRFDEFTEAGKWGAVATQVKGWLHKWDA